jgi:hypothetical protein
MITSEQTKSLASHFHHVQFFEFFGGHYVPQTKEFCAVLTKFLEETNLEASLKMLQTMYIDQL